MLKRLAFALYALFAAIVFAVGAVDLLQNASDFVDISGQVRMIGAAFAFLALVHGALVPVALLAKASR